MLKCLQCKVHQKIVVCSTICCRKIVEWIAGIETKRKTREMNNRNDRRGIAEDTLQILKQGFFITPVGDRVNISELQKLAEVNTIVYSPEETDNILVNRSNSVFSFLLQVLI